MNIPTQLKYTKEHEWVSVDGEIATVGVTDFAQSELGDIVFVELPKVGASVTQGKPFGTIEAVKAVSELYAPLSGVVVAANAGLNDNPMAINRGPYTDGWLIKIKANATGETNGLLTHTQYAELLS